jgi:hypothetical protein
VDCSVFEQGQPACTFTVHASLLLSMQQEKKILLLIPVPDHSVSSVCRALLDISPVFIRFLLFFIIYRLSFCGWSMHGSDVFALLPPSFTIHHSLIRPSLFLLGSGFRLLGRPTYDDYDFIFTRL